MTSEVVRDPPRRAPDAAADVEEALAGPGLKQVHQFLRREEPPAVKVVERY